MRSRWLLLLLAIVLAAPASAGWNVFKTREPEQLFQGTSTRLEPGVYVVRTVAEFDSVLSRVEGAPEDPPDFGEGTLLVIVGGDREFDCRRTSIDVGYRLRTARVTVEELRPGKGCHCNAQEPVRLVFGVIVAPFVRKAKLKETSVTVDCSASGPLPADGPVKPEPALSGTLVEGEPGVSLIASGEAWQEFCARMNQSGSCPAFDASRQRGAVVIGEPLENACRRTVQEGVRIEGALATLVVREIEPRDDQQCAQVFGGHQVYAFLVPASVEEVALDSRRVK